MDKLGPEDAKLFQNVAKLLQDMAKHSGVIHSNLRSSAGHASDMASSEDKIKNILDKVVEFNKDLVADNDMILASKEIQIKALKTGMSLARAEVEVAKEKALLEAKNLGASEDMIKQINEQYEAAIKNNEQNEKLEESLEHQKHLAEYISEAEEERKKLLEGITSKARTLKDIFTDQRVAAAIFTSQLIKGYDTSKELFEEVRHEGHSVKQAFHEAGLAMSDAFSLSGASAKDSLEVMGGMRSEMGSIHHVTKEARLEAASLAKTFGIANEQAGQITAQFATMPGATMESANNALEFAGNLAVAAHVAPGEVMKDIATNAEDVATFSKDGGKNIGVAAVAAKKLGMEFGSLTKMAGQLVDFENSINQQMEASVLLGKEINLDKAREAALNGDLVGMTEEVLKNVGGEAEFNNMNMMQRKALADSLGVSVTDLGKMVKHQDELSNLTQEQQEALALGETTMDEVLANAGGFTDKMYEGAKTVGSMVGGFGEFVGGIKEGVAAAGELAKSFGGMVTKMFPSLVAGMSKFGGAIKSKLGFGKAPELAKADAMPKTDAVADAGKKMGGPGLMAGFKSNMKSLAGGFKAMANPQVLAGIGVTALAGPALVIALPAIPFLLFMGLTPLAQLGTNFMNLGIGLEFMGSGKVALGSLNTMLFAVAGVVGLAAIPFMITIALLGTVAGAGLMGLAAGLTAMGNPVVALGAGILAVVLLSAGASMLMFGAGVGIAAAGMSLLVASLKDIPFENLIALPIALMGIGTGLAMMAVAGLSALPVLGALAALAVVAPALIGLGGAMGNMFGGGGKGEEEDKMQVIADKLDQLIAIASKGGEIKMDGKKVGEVLRLGLNTSNVR